jgi:2,4-dienoyl-CoA reductase-like NADH-dependent reductase (Old Yellow Enzyme family)
MEGWDGTDDGRPTDLVRRRWSRFGTSGAGLVWGGEAFAVRPEGRANPHQLCLGPSSADDLAELHALLDPAQVTGLQLTHSGRWSVEPRPARNDPLLDARRSGPVLTDDELDALADDYVAAAALAQRAGFDFVDVKACHGYLLHELLSGHDREGRHGGGLEGRTRLLRAAIDGVRELGLTVGVRLSVFDVCPHRAGPDRTGVPEGDGPFGFNEPVELLDLLGVDLVCVTAGSPYYSPHVQRPAYFPPSDGYQPPEDPLVGVARLLDACAALAAARPHIAFVASGLTYLQEWVPHVSSAVVRTGGAALVGLGRMALSYPDLPADVLAGRPPDRRRLCRTFSDCTTAPRNGLVSGCWPLDDFYKSRPDRSVLAAVKKAQRAGPSEAKGG